MTFLKKNYFFQNYFLLKVTYFQGIFLSNVSAFSTPPKTVFQNLWPFFFFPPPIKHICSCTPSSWWCWFYLIRKILYALLFTREGFKTFVQEPVSVRLQRQGLQRGEVFPLDQLKKEKKKDRANFHTDKPLFKYEHQKAKQRNEVGSSYKSCLFCSFTRANRTTVVTECLQGLSFVKVFSFKNSIK